MKESKTQQAIRLMRENPGMTQYKACQLVGVSQAAVSKARTVLREKEEIARKIEQGGYLS